MTDNKGKASNEQQVEDQGTTKIPGEDVANAAAESLHGDRAAVEQYKQPDARMLPGDGTLIADPDGEPVETAERRTDI